MRASDDVAFAWSEGRLTRRGNSVKPFEHTGSGSGDPSQARSDLGLVSPYGAQLASGLEAQKQVLFLPQIGPLWPVFLLHKAPRAGR